MDILVGARRWNLWIPWIVAVLYVVLVFGFQTAYAITKSGIGHENGFSGGEIGLIGSIYTVAFSLTQVGSGALLDRVGSRRVLPVAASFFTVGVILFSQSHSLMTFLFAQVLVAMGAAFGFIGAGFVGGQQFGMARYGFLFSLVQFIASLAAFSNQRAFSYLVDHASWRTILLIMGLSAGAIVILMLAVLHDPPSWSQQAHPIPAPGEFVHTIAHDVHTVVTKAGMIPVLIVGAASFGGMLALGAVWGPDLGVHRGLSTGTAQLATSLIWLGLAFGAPSMVWIADRLRNDRLVLQVSVVGQTIVMLIALYGPLSHSWTMMILYFLIGFLCGGSMIPFSLAAKLVADQLAGTSASLVNGSQFIVGGLLIALPGRLLSVVNTQHAIASIPVLLMAAALMFPWLPRVGSSDPDA